jgi:hypothetical protein
VPDAVVYLLVFNFVERILCFCLDVKVLHVHQFLEPLAVEDLLNLAEDHLDGVVLWRVRQVEDGLDVEFDVCFLSGQGLVDTKVVHEDSQGCLTIDETDPVQELDEFPLVEGLVLYCKRFHTCLFADGGTDADILPVHLVLVDADVLALAAPVLLADAQLGEVDLV